MSSSLHASPSLSLWHSKPRAWHLRCAFVYATIRFVGYFCYWRCAFDESALDFCGWLTWLRFFIRLMRGMLLMMMMMMARHCCVPNESGVLCCSFRISSMIIFLYINECTPHSFTRRQQKTNDRMRNEEEWTREAHCTCTRRHYFKCTSIVDTLSRCESI